MSEAKRATAAAIDALRDGVAFAVVAGRGDAAMAYPERPSSCAASQTHPGRGQGGGAELTAAGGTAMGQWLELATRCSRAARPT